MPIILFTKNKGNKMACKFQGVIIRKRGSTYKNSFLNINSQNIMSFYSVTPIDSNA